MKTLIIFKKRCYLEKSSRKTRGEKENQKKK